MKYKDGYVVSLIFDGTQLICNDKITEELLEECRIYTAQKIGYDIQIKIKPFDNVLNLPEDYKLSFNPEEYINSNVQDISANNYENIISSADDDQGACNIIMSSYKDLFINCNGVLYVYNNNVWCFNEEEVNKIISNMIVRSRIMYKTTTSLRSYSSSYNHQKNCIKCIKNSISIKVDDNFINNLNHHNKYYLPFKNGIWSFNDKKLYNYDDLPNVNFTHIINRELTPYGLHGVRGTEWWPLNPWLG